MSADGRTGERVPSTGAILAGGMSSRMGEPKQDIALADGRTMIEHVHGAMATVCERVVILGDCQSLPELQRVRDLRPNQGPLGGIEALLASGIDSHYLVCPCDVPRITPHVFHALLIASERPATMFDDHPLPARIDATALAIVQQLLNDEHRAVWRLMEALDAERVAIPEGCETMLRNVNSPHDVDLMSSKRSPSGRG